MRRLLMASVAVVVVLGVGALAYRHFHQRDLLKDAQLHYQAGDVYGAGLDLNTYLHAHPDSGEANFRFGLVYLAQDNPVAAEHELQRARAEHFDPKALILPLGEAYLREHRYDDVLTDFTVAGAPPGALADVQAVRASAYLALKRYGEAKQAAAAGIEAAPNSPDPLLVSARVDLETGDVDGASALVDRMLAHDPQRVDGQLVKAEIAMHRNDPATALKLAQAVIAASPQRLDAKMAAARALAAQHQELAASKLVDQVLQRAPRDVGANYLRLVLAVRQRDFVTADATLNVLGPIIDDLPSGDYFLAMTKLGRNQPAQAQEAAAKYVARSPDEPAGQKLLAFTELALHRPDRALAVLKPLMAKSPDADTLSLLARAQATTGNIQGAEQNLTQAAALQPNNTDILNSLAAAKLELGETEEGRAELRQSLQTSPDQPMAAQALVQTALAQGDTDDAQATVDRLRKAVGDTELMGILDAQVKTAKLDLPGARAIYADVLKRFPESRDATFGLVQVNGRLGDTKTAEMLLTGWMAQHPTDTAGLQLQVSTLVQGGDTDGAVAAAEAAHAADPNDTGVTALLASLYISAKRPDQAASLLERADNGQNPPLAVLHAQALQQAGHTDDATAALQAAIAATPTDLRPRFALIQMDMKQKDYDAAHAVVTDGLSARPGDLTLMQAQVAIDLKANGIKSALQTAATLAQDPQNLPGALLLPGGALDASGDFAGAATSFVAAFKQSPSETLLMAATNALLKAGKRADAHALLESWLPQHPNSVAVLESLANIALGDHRPDEAGAMLDRILALRPNNGTALNNRAWVKLSRNDIPGAHEDAMRAFYLMPEAETQDTLGWTLAKSGQTAQALPMIEHAASAKPTPTILYHYASVLAASGRPRDAGDALDRALANNAVFLERDDALALKAKLAK